MTNIFCKYNIVYNIVRVSVVLLADKTTETQTKHCVLV